MHKTLMTRRTLINTGAALAAVSAVGCSPVTFASGPAIASGSLLGAALAKNFVSIGVIRTLTTGAAAAEFINQPGTNAASKDLLFLPSLVADIKAPEAALLAKSARANNVWLAFSARRGQRLTNMLIDSTGNLLELAQPDAGISVMPTSLGNVAFVSGSSEIGPRRSSEHGDAEIVLLTSHGQSYTGAYTISSDAIYAPGGEIIETASNPAQPLISVRIPIADFRKLRRS